MVPPSARSAAGNTWVSSTLDEDVLERALGLVPLYEGVIAACGSGRQKTSDGDGLLQPSFVPLDQR
jgi:hypothetical protein